MDKFEFGDLNRFLVSLGLALIASSVALAWLFFREPFDLTIPIDTLQKMTPLARSVVERRQAMMGSVLTVLPWASGAGTIGGALLVLYGLWRWIPYQRDYELLQRTARLRAEHEYRQMTSAEVVERARQDVVAEQSSFGGAAPSMLDAAVTDYIANESALFDALESRLPEDYELLSHQRTPMFSFDALLRSRSARGPEYIIEFKNLSPDASSRLLVEALRHVSEAAGWLGLDRKVRQIPLVVAVTPNITGALTESATRFIRETTNNLTPFGSSLVRLLTPAGLRHLSAKDVQAFLDTSQRLLVFNEQGEAHETG
jgi:hypothetical protein